MKTILVTFPFGIAARNVVCSRLVDKLCEKGFRVVILAPEKSFGLLREFYPDAEKVVLESYPRYESFFHGGVFRGASQLEMACIGLINSSLITGAVKYRRRELLFKKRYFRYVLRWFFQTVFSGHYGWSEWFRKIDARFFPDTWFKEIFDKFNPVAAFSPHVQFDFNLIKRARTEGVPSFGQILSIDNLTTKGNIRTKSDYLFVWNKTMKEEAVKYNLYDADRVIPAGIPQYDLAFDNSVLMPREEFCKQLGIDPAKKIILYASEGKGDSPDDDEILEFMVEKMRSKEICESVSIIARPHPRDYMRPFENIKNMPEIVISDPRTRIDVFIDRWYPSMDNIKLAANLLYHSALVIVTVSTMGLDACSYNKPVITIGFDLHKRPIYQSALRYYKFFDHQRYWLDTGAYKLVQSKEELISQINTYLKHPETDNDARQKLIDKIFYKFDGRVGERMANIIMDNAKK